MNGIGCRAVETGAPMPRQNRVNPFGEIIATPERGTFMGNRGVLHDDEGRIRRKWQGKRWIVCVLEFRGRKRKVMTPSRYTELFFLDEATALAAGHRPCAECRRERFTSFCCAWQQAHPQKGGSQSSAFDIDACLHAERVAQRISRWQTWLIYRMASSSNSRKNLIWSTTTGYWPGRREATRKAWTVRTMPRSSS
jgi:hypothetical protein